MHLNIENDSVSPPSSQFHGYAEEEIRNVTISGTLARPTVCVLLCMFQFLVEDEERQQHSNPLTVVTKTSILRSAELTTPVIKTVWEHHFSDILINKKETKIIVDDREITDKLVKLFEELKTIDQESRWAERKDTENVIKRRKRKRN